MNKKHILVAVTGGIAAYKACDIVSQLNKLDFETKVIMTKNAAQFVAPITLETLSHYKVETDVFDPSNPDPIAHISLAKWADLVLVVPATANSIAKIACGIADDLVSTTILACTCDTIVCPAMNVHMYENTATQYNLEILKDRGFIILEPVSGHLACDDIGKGKLPAVGDIVEAVENYFSKKQSLKGKNILVSAGPTQEALDPVRFISNHSSGKQGYAIAKEAIKQGAHVTLISGPVSLEPVEGADMVYITSALEMEKEVQKYAPDADYIIMAAAVGDYRAKEIQDQKIKKGGDSLIVEFVKNPDILKWLGENKKPGQVLCGFAMETQNLIENAKAKLEGKNCDMLVANNLFVEGAGFQTSTNVATLLFPEGIESLKKCSKSELGAIILEKMQQIERNKKSC